ncbi:hypothetical protein MBLNU459_g2147t1 [Dothideomycetes sp. NU459]
MPRKNVYGKRTQLYSNFTTFASPVKSRTKAEVVDIAEVTQELENLNVHVDPTGLKSNEAVRVRRPLFQRDGNATINPERSSRRNKKTKNHTRQEDQIPADVEQSLRTQSCTRDPVPVVTYISPTERSLPHAVETIDSTPSAQPQDTTPPIESFTPSTSNIYTKHTSSLLSLSSNPLISFDTWSDQISSHFAITKIAEASFGEVYRLALSSSSSALTKADESVLKIVALKPPSAIKKKMSKAAKKRTEMMSSPEDVASEVRLMQQMTCIPGFTNFRELCVLQGRPGKSFVSAWSNWNESQKQKGKETSVFPDPGKKASYNEEQLWAVIEMQDAGTDLENIKVNDIWMTWDVFWGVVLALGKGEEAVRFEHRDLHMGNICVSGLKTDHGSGHDPVDTTRKLGYTGIETTLIDYTISRAEIGSAHQISGEEEDVAFLDLEKDLTLFDGDADEEYQYEIYRHMRAAVYLDDPLADVYDRWEEAEASGRTWRGYHPQTNLVWLHFILHELLKQFDWQKSDAQLLPNRRDDVVLRAKQIRSALSQLQHLLDPQELPHSGLRSASNLVGLALDEGWLDKEDVQGRNPASTGQRLSRRRQKRSRTKKA